MDVNKILAALRQERAQIEEVIINLELLALTRERRRGRPPAILAAARKRGRPKGSKNKDKSQQTLSAELLRIKAQLQKALFWIKKDRKSVV